MRLVLADLGLIEPEGNLVVGRLNGIRSVDDVAADIDGEITTDGTRKRLKGTSLTEHLTDLLDNVNTLPNHANNRAGRHVLNKSREEGLASKVSIVLLEELLGGALHLEGNKLVTTLLEALHDLVNKTALDAVGLNHDIGTLGLGHGY